MIHNPVLGSSVRKFCLSPLLPFPPLFLSSSPLFFVLFFGLVLGRGAVVSLKSNQSSLEFAVWVGICVMVQLVDLWLFLLSSTSIVGFKTSVDFDSDR